MMCNDLKLKLPDAPVIKFITTDNQLRLELQPGPDLPQPDHGGINVQADWQEADSLAPSYIKHKPTTLSAFNNDVGYVDDDSFIPNSEILEILNK